MLTYSNPKCVLAIYLRAMSLVTKDPKTISADI